MRLKISASPFAQLLPATTLSTSLLFSLPLEAATVTWDSGGADNNWSTAANWDTDATPANGDDLVFTGVGETVNQDFLPGSVLSINSLTFDSAAGAFELTSTKAMRLVAGMNNQSGQLQSIKNNNQIQLVQSQTWDAGSGGLNIGAELYHSALGDLDLTFTGGGDTSISGQIWGDHPAEKLGLIKNGSGTLTLSASNGYYGDTTINAGVVSISSAANLGSTKASGGGDVVLNGGTLQTTGSLSLDKDFSINDPSGGTVETASGTTLTLTGVVSGSGDFVKSGDGTLVLNGTNTFSDDLTVEAGTVSVSRDANLGGGVSWLYLDGGTLQTTADFSSSRTFVMDAGHGTLAIDSGTTLTLNGVVQGAGNLTKTGDGTLVLAGTNTYTGTTSVNSGLLTVNGTTTSATTVNSGGTLGGNGTVGDLALNGGTLAPGNSIGTLRVSGDVTFGSGVYEVEVDAAGNSDKVEATGTADLSGARVSVLPEAGSYASSTDYTILEAGTVSNTFTGVSVDDSNFAFLDASLSYSATDVTLSLVRNDIDYGEVAETRNQRAVGDALQALNDGSASSGMNDLLGEINILSSDAARNAYEQLSGVGHANSLVMSRQSQQRFGRMINNRAQQRSSNQGLQTAGYLRDSALQLASLTTPDSALSSQQTEQGLQYWITPVYGEGNVDGDGNASGMDYQYTGLALGVDQQMHSGWLVGAGLSYSQSDASFAAGSTDMDGVELALYSRWDRGAPYVKSYAGLGWYGSDSERHITLGGNSTATADYDTTAAFIGVEGGHAFVFSKQMLLTPYVGLDYAYSDRESFSESGAGAANLDVESEQFESVQSTAGLRFEQLFGTEQGDLFAWNLNAAWLHEFADKQAYTQASFANNGFASFSVAGQELDRNRLLLGGGIAKALTERSTLSVDYSGEFANSNQDQRLSLSFEHQW